MLETPQCFIINAHELKAHHVQGDAQWIIIYKSDFSNNFDVIGKWNEH